MKKFKFASCEYCFPVWGSLAVEMAAEAGFDGIEITDGGGYLQPHPDNNGFVEYERLGLDLSRQDNFPLTDPFIQDDYMEAAAKHGIKLMGIYLYLLENQGFIKNSDDSKQGQHCRETIKKAIESAAAMGIPQVTLPVRGLFGVFQHEYAFQKIKYAQTIAEENGVRLLIVSDGAARWQKEIVDRTEGKVKLSFNTLDPVVCAAGKAPEMIQELGKEYIRQIRARDLKAGPDGFVTRLGGENTTLATGDADFLQSAEEIKKSGISGWVVSETPYYSGQINKVGGDFCEAASRDINLDSGFIYYPVDGLSSRSDDYSHFIRVDVHGDRSRSVLGKVRTRSFQLFHHLAHYIHSAFLGLLQSLFENVSRQSVNLYVHLDGGNALVGTGHLEVHVAQEVFHSLYI